MGKIATHSFFSAGACLIFLVTVIVGRGNIVLLAYEVSGFLTLLSLCFHPRVKFSIIGDEKTASGRFLQYVAVTYYTLTAVFGYKQSGRQEVSRDFASVFWMILIIVILSVVFVMAWFCMIYFMMSPFRLYLTLKIPFPTFSN